VGWCGICVSAAVRDQVGDRLDVRYEDLGGRQVKNINRPIHVFKVLIDDRISEPQVVPNGRPVSGWKRAIGPFP
jgi:adenylate cyclase